MQSTSALPPAPDRSMDPARLRGEWDEGKNRKQRQRDIAQTLGVSEAELVASACGDFVTRLSGDFRKLLPRISELGPVMALTRNASCVHEKIGLYENLSFDGHVGLALGTDIDLRLFMSQWKLGYALREATDAGPRESLQFYDKFGEAVHKIFLRPTSNRSAFDEIVSAFAAAAHAPGERVEPAVALTLSEPDTKVDRNGLLHAWSQMKDTHEFFGMLKKYKVERTQALRLAEGTYTRALPPASVRQVLTTAAESQLPIMVFVGNRGCIQIHTGPVANIKVLGDWVNVLDPGFSLHLREPDIDRAWVVVKPTSDGVVTSVELFDQRGENIAMIFGKRKPGIPELLEWRQLVETLGVARNV